MCYLLKLHSTDWVFIIGSTAQNMKAHSRSPHQPVAVESGVHAPEEEPARPQILQSELKDEICQEHHRPHHHKLQEGVRTVERCAKFQTNSFQKPLPW